MACPYFDAVKPRSRTSDSRAAMLPLGDAWEGVCRAVPDAIWEPDETTLVSVCNMGYARGCCSHFPAEDGPDAARFTIAGSDAAGLHLYYVLERDHHPWSHGPLDFSPDGTVFVGPSTGETTLRLARAYVESYLRRNSEASRH